MKEVETKKVVKTVRKIIKVKTPILNPDYNEYRQIKGMDNYVDKYVYVETETIGKVEVSRIHYKLECKFCKSEFWGKTKNKMYCSQICGQHYRLQQEQKQTNEKI